MHGRPQEENQSFFKQLIGSLPVVGSFVDPEKNMAEKFDGALYEASSITAQVAMTYHCPFQLTAGLPKVSDNMKWEMNIEMGAEMAARMYVGELAGKFSYQFLSRPLKIVINNYVNDTFTENAKDFAVKIAQLLPLLGPFLGEEDWRKAVKQGVAANISGLAMLTGGTLAMMLSPYGMEVDAASISVGTGLMIVGMAVPELVKTISSVTWSKSMEALNDCRSTMWKRNQPRKMLDLQEQEEAKLLELDGGLDNGEKLRKELTSVLSRRG